MKTLRRRASRAFRTLLSVAAPALVLAALTLATVEPAHASTGTRSRSHHVLNTPLPSAGLLATSGPRAARRGKATAHGRAIGSGQGTGQGTGRGHVHAGAGRHGHVRSPEPGEDSRPALWRAERRRGQGASSAVAYSRSRGVSRRGHPEDTVAEVTGRSRGGNYLVHLRSKSGLHAGYPAHGRYAGESVSVAAARPARNRAFGMSGVGNPMFDPTRSVPGENDSAARQLPAPSGAMIGTAVVMAAPAASFRAQSPQPAPGMQVVSGFGSEVALASPEPGATRPRPHPPAGTPLPGFPPATLAERDALTEAAVSPAVLPVIYDRDGHLVMPAPLKGSHDVLVHQNQMATADGLGRIQDEGDLDRLRAAHQLVNFPETDGLRMNPELPVDRRCARPWTVLFAQDLAQNFFNRFHQPLVVTSAVRTVSYQARLQRVNGNAAATDGDAASPHLTGQALDFGKRGMTAAQIAWMRAYLLPLMEAGAIDVEEEFQQACFHISVYRRYTGARGPAQVVAQMRPGTAAQTQPYQP